MDAMSTWKKRKKRVVVKTAVGELEMRVGGSSERVLRAMGDDRWTIGTVRAEARTLEVALDKQLPCRGLGCPGPGAAHDARSDGDHEELMDVMAELCVHCRALLHMQEVVALLEERAADVGLPAGDPPYDDEAVGDDDCPICRELGIDGGG